MQRGDNSFGRLPDGLQGVNRADDPSQLAERKSQYKAERDDLLRRHLALVDRYDWALAVATELARCPKGIPGLLAQCLPHGLWRWFQMRRLRRKKLFDLRAYRNRYPDTRRSRFGVLAHFLRWGIHEGRAAGPNAAPAPLEHIDVGLQETILRSGLFDPEWYAETYGVAASTPELALRDYLSQSQIDPLRDPGPLFSGAHYLLENPDTARINPLQHFISCGMAEGRRAFSPAAADRFMTAAAGTVLAVPESLLDPGKPTVVLCWEQGNFFFEDIARYVCEFLAQRGYQAERRFDDAGIDPERCNLVVVAPHEYCIHGPGRHWSDRQFSHPVYVNTEQWHTSWFSLALGVMVRSGKALDINPASARGLARLGLTAAFLPLVPTIGETFNFPSQSLSPQTTALRAMRALTYPSDAQQRPYDILYVAALNERRARILAGLAPHLAKHDCFLHTPALQGPVTARSANMIPSADVSQLARNSKILLNIHQGASRYFEWHRLFVSGICEGCVVVTEPCIETGLLVPGVHYLEVEPELMGQYLDWLLLTPEGARLMDEVRANCSGLQQELFGAGVSR